MKKILYAVAAFALVLTGCSKKEFTETFAPGDVLTIHAQVNDNYTKVAADNAGTFTWQDGDKISILNKANKAFELATVKGGTQAAFTTTGFEGELGTIAYYPASDAHTNTVFNLASEFDWVQDASNMPMIGTVNTSEKKVSFKTAGAVIKLVCYNVADGARKLVVSSDSKNLSGDMTITSGAITTSAGSNNVTINFAAGHPSTMVFYIPVPTGDLGKLSFVVKDDSDANVSNVQTTKGNIKMERQHMVAAPAMNCSGGEILWSEDFSDYASGSVPSGSVDKGFGGANVTYACTDGGGTTKIFEEATGGGTSPELLVAKSNGTFEVTNIPTNGAASMALKYKTNAKTLTLSSPTTGISFSTTSTKTKEEHTIIITNTGKAPSFGITFTATTTDNVRLDDILLTSLGASYTAPSITTDKESLSIPKAGGSDKTTFTLTDPIAGEGDSDVKATVEEGATSWLTASISGNELTVSAGENTEADRSAKITLRATGAIKVIEVTQPSNTFKTSTLTFTAACEGKGTADNGVEWTITSDGAESTYDDTKGIHYGTNSKAVQYIKLTTSDISGTITKVVVNASTASSVSATASVTVGGSAFGGAAQSISTTAADYTFSGSASGEIIVTVTKPSSATKAIYVKSVAVTYK